MNEIFFVVEAAPEGGYVARALVKSIITEADELDQLYARVWDAIRCHFEEDEMPRVIRLHFTQDEVITL